MRVLCLGNNTEDTDVKTRQLAHENSSECYGLLSELDGPITMDLKPGWYHSSIYDIESGRLKELASKFDSVIMLNQPREQYTHADAFYRTVDLVKNLPNGKLLDPGYARDINFFEELVNTNKSFCIFPFIELLTNLRTDGQTTICCRSEKPITHVSKIVDWQTNKEYTAIRNKMLNGVMVPEHCSSCYELEDKNILSARQQETVEWANRLHLTSLEDLSTITHPAYFEVHPSNTCNLQCRTCGPFTSHLLGKEFKKLNLLQDLPSPIRGGFEIVDFTNLKKLYVAGGEPTATPSFFDFVDQCIKNKKTDFEFLINTNGIKLSERFKKQLTHFSTVHFIVSVDGYNKVNHYIRWPADWDTLTKNIHYLRKHKHTVSINTTVSIYNVTGLCDLLKFFDNEFPGILVHCQDAVTESVVSTVEKDVLSGFNFPDSKLAIEKLLPIQQLNCYKNDKLLKSFIDGLLTHYQSEPKTQLGKLKAFFEFNDKLDQSRNIKLADYIPELEQARKLI